MPRIGWMQLKSETPDYFRDRSFYTDCQILETKLESIDFSNDLDDVMSKLIRLRTKVDDVMQDFARQIYSISEEIYSMDDFSDYMFQVIEINLRYYRQEKIDGLIEDSMDVGSARTNSRGMGKHQVEMLRSNMLNLVRTIKQVLHDSNLMFERTEVDNDSDERVTYLALLAKNFESSIKYFGRNFSENSEDQVLDAVNEAAGGEVTEKKIEDEMDTIDDVLDDAEDELNEI